MAENKKVYVVGHKNPDTDSICTAIAYANLKTKITGETYEPRRAGQLNEETQYVLEHFGVKVPLLLSDLREQIKNVELKESQEIQGSLSIRTAWEKMSEMNTHTIPITRNGVLEGVITKGDIAKSYMEVYDNTMLAKARTQYRNIAAAVEGEIVTGNEHGYFYKGKVTVAASSKELMTSFIEKDDLVIIGDRIDAQQCAVDLDASCMVVCQNDPISEDILRQAEAKEIVVIWTQHDTFTAAQHISQSIPVRSFMTKDQLVTFRKNDYVDDVKEVMARKRFRDFPVVDEDGKFLGLVSRRRLLNVSKKQVILVDHNEKNQAVAGIENAEILEIIDHHRIGSLETSGPVYFRNQPVGCTATIITQMYDENGVTIPQKTAGLLLAAILSDTLVFRSPTCTPIDVNAANRLAKIAGVDINEFANEMFEAGEKLDGKTAEEVFLQDFKVFMCGDIRFGVAQGSYMTRKNLTAAEALLKPYLEEARNKQNVEDIYMLLTDVPKEESVVICNGRYAAEVLSDGFDTQPAADASWTLPGVVSRKKQFIPALMTAYQEL